MKAAQVKSINSLARGLSVLQLLQTSGAMRLQDLHAATAIPKASLLRILKTLHEQGMIWQRMVDDAYVPSFSLSELSGRMDQEHALVEVASPILEALSAQIKWPSVLAVPRLTHMEVIETNASRAYFDKIPLGPVGFRVNMLRSASGRAYLAACEEPVRETILQALRRSAHKGDRLAHSPAYVQAVIEQVRAQGFALRDADFGGDFDEGRSVVNDGRDSLGVAIRIGAFVVGAINITWAQRALKREAAVARFSGPALKAADDIAKRLASFTG